MNHMTLQMSLLLCPLELAACRSDDTVPHVVASSVATDPDIPAVLPSIVSSVSPEGMYFRTSVLPNGFAFLSRRQIVGFQPENTGDLPSVC